MLFVTFLLCGFASAVANRTLDPLTLAVAQDMNVSVASAALLASATFLPYALMQPVLGPVGDHFGKARVIKIALWIAAIGTLASAFAPAFIFLVLLRVFTGAASGGIIPVTQALIGDLVKPAERQVTIARFTMSMILGQMLGAAFAGALEAWIGWRGVLFLFGLIVVLAAAAATYTIPAAPARAAGTFSIATAIANYRTIFRNPRAYACYITTPIVGGLTFGILPFISPILQSQNNGGTREAGFIIAGQAVGSLALPLLLPLILRRMARPTMMAGGALIAAASLTTFAFGWHWSVQATIFAFFGFGFFMLHNSIQYEVSELSQAFRGSAYSMHAFFFFIGQFLGPIVYGQLIPLLGARNALILAALIIGVTGVSVSFIFRRLSLKSAALR